MSANEYSPVAGNRFTRIGPIGLDNHLKIVLQNSRIGKVQNFEVKTMFSQGDDEKMEDLWLKMLQSHEFIRQGHNVAINFNL